MNARNQTLKHDEEVAPSIAAHEAGHAVAAALGGLYVYGMRMNETDGVTSNEPAGSPEAEARLAASGFAAELLLPEFIWHDPIHEVDGSDFSRFKRLHPQLEPHEAAEAFHAQIASQVEQLREHTDLIAALACELLEAHEFEDGIVQGHVVDEYLIDLPSYARRFADDGIDVTRLTDQGQPAQTPEQAKAA
jgi:hypothetical protein